MKKFLYILLFIYCNSFSQEYITLPFVNFSEKDGLPDKFIYGCDQDAQGYLWIATGSGLYRYNGTKFTLFKSNLDVPNHQISNILQTIYYDKKGFIWLSSINDIQRYNLKEQKFEGFQYNATITNLIKSNITSFYRDSNNLFWIATASSFWYLYDEKQNKTISFLPKGDIAKDSRKIAKIIETSNQLWAIGENGIFNFDKNGIINSFQNKENNIAIKNSFSDGFYDAKHDCIWLAARENGIAKFDLKTQKFHYFTITSSRFKEEHLLVDAIAKKSEDAIYFGGGEFGYFSILEQKYYIVSKEFRDEFSFKTHKIQKLFADKEHNLWICSHNGFSQVPWQNNQIRNITLKNPKNSYNVEPINTIAIGKNKWLIANDSSNGLLLWDSSTNNFELIENNNYKNKTSLGIIGLHKTTKGIIYASDNLGVYQYDLSKKKLIPQGFIQTDEQHYINRIISDSNENLYMTSTNNGFYYYNKLSNKLKHYNLWDIDTTIKSRENNTVSARFVDKNNNVWITLTSGVYCFDPSTGRFIHYATGKAHNTNAQILNSFDIVQDKVGHFWITTKESGLFELIIKDKKEILYNYTKTNSGNLPTDYCYKLVCDQKGFLWIGTLTGLVKFNPATGSAKAVYTQQNGLHNTNIDVTLNLQENGDLVVNNYATLSIINTLSFNLNVKKEKVHIEDIKNLDKEIRTLVDNNKLVLEHNQNTITINWSYLVLNNSNKNRFAYKLLNYDSKWKMTNLNETSFSNLEDGHYVFVIKAVNNDGVWSDETQLAITINPPFWKTWWFFLLSFMLLTGSVYSFYKLKTNQIKKEEALKTFYAKQLAEVEMKALRAQMNPHFIFNSLNSIQKYILKNDTFAASQYLTKFSKLIRLILDHSNQNFISLSSEIELLKLYVEIEDMRFDNQFDYHFEIAENINSESIQIPSMIIQPYIENAIWHGLLHKETKGRLSITFKEKDGCIKVVVDDDGIGRKKALEIKSKQVLKKKSYGLQITEDRISILNKTQNSKTKISIIDKKDKNDSAIGTKVELLIPVKTINHD